MVTGGIAVGTREGFGAGEPRTQGETSRAVSETLQDEEPRRKQRGIGSNRSTNRSKLRGINPIEIKKLGDWLRRHKSVSTAVITAQNLTQLPKVPNQVAGIEQLRLPAHD
jgi:hypothetical protein